VLGHSVQAARHLRVGGHVQRVEGVERDGVANGHSIGRLRRSGGAQDGYGLGRTDFGAFGIRDVSAAGARFQIHPGGLQFGIVGEDGGERARAVGPGVFIDGELAQGAHIVDGRSGGEIVQLLALGQIF
jgi:hypothetical protein